MFEGDERCPFCYSSIQAVTEEYSSESETERQQMIDSGAFLGQDTEKIKTLAEAEAKDQLIEKIPDPNENTIPIPENQPCDNSMSLLEMMKKVFRSKGKS